MTRAVPQTVPSGTCAPSSEAVMLGSSSSVPYFPPHSLRAARGDWGGCMGLCLGGFHPDRVQWTCEPWVPVRDQLRRDTVVPKNMLLQQLSTSFSSQGRGTGYEMGHFGQSAHHDGYHAVDAVPETPATYLFWG